MRRQYVILLFLLLVVLVMAGNRNMPSFNRFHLNDTINYADEDTVAEKLEKISSDSAVALADSQAMAIDTTLMDSLELAIYHHNKAIDDSIRKDSLNRLKPNAIESPVHYSSEDSMIYLSATRKAYLFGDSKVQYENMDLEAD